MPLIRIPLITDLDTLPRLEPLPSERIVTPETPAQLAEAVDALMAWRHVGFDTESKPTFRAGEVSTGPHLIQLATPEKAFLFQVGVEGAVAAARTVLEATQVLKVGFGLGSDRSRLRTRLDIELRPFIDLRHDAALPGQEGPGRLAWRCSGRTRRPCQQVTEHFHLQLGQPGPERGAASVCRKRCVCRAAGLSRIGR